MLWSTFTAIPWNLYLRSLLVNTCAVPRKTLTFPEASKYPRHVPEFHTSNCPTHALGLSGLSGGSESFWRCLSSRVCVKYKWGSEAHFIQVHLPFSMFHTNTHVCNERQWGRELVVKLCCGKKSWFDQRKIDQYIYILMPINHLFNGEKEKTWHLVLVVLCSLVRCFCKTSYSQPSCLPHERNYYGLHLRKLRPKVLPTISTTTRLLPKTHSPSNHPGKIPNNKRKYSPGMIKLADCLFSL